MKQTTKKTTMWRSVVGSTMIGVVGLSLSLPAAANKFYKWVDEQGTTHYSAQPPREKPSAEVNIHINTPSKSDAPASQSTSAQPDKEQPSANSDADRAAEIERRNREAIAKNCEIMRNNLQTLTQNSRVRSIGEDGEARMLGEEERQERIKKAQDYINANCK